MKFLFCCNSDCPDWVIANVTDVSKVTSIRFSNLCIIIVDNYLLNNAQIKLSIDNNEKALKIINDQYLIDKLVATVIYILKMSAKSNIKDSSVLVEELLQIGFPKEHANSLGKLFKKYSSDIKNILLNNYIQGGYKIESESVKLELCEINEANHWILSFVVLNHDGLRIQKEIILSYIQKKLLYSHLVQSYSILNNYKRNENITI